MLQVPPIMRTKKRRDKLLATGLIEKNVWVPAIFADEFAALELRRRARLPLPAEPDWNDQPVPSVKNSGHVLPHRRVARGAEHIFAPVCRRTAS